MASKARWSEKDLAAYKKAKPTLNVVSPEKVAAIKEATKRNSSADRERLRKSVIESIKHSTISGSHERGRYIEIKLEGARLLSENFIRATNPFKLIAYKKACHQAVEWAMLLITGGQRNFDKFTWFKISAHIQSERRVDTDAKEVQLKYLIDGLTKSGIIEDDSPKYFAKWGDFEHTTGKPFVLLRIEPAPPLC
jgi:hypothetical protein